MFFQKWYNGTMKDKRYTREQLNTMSPEELAQLVLDQQKELDEKARLMEDQRKELDEKDRLVADKQKELQEKIQLLDLLQEQIRTERMQKYGRKTEQHPGQLEMVFNEAEANLREHSEEPKAEEVFVAEHVRKKTRPKGKLEEDLSGLPCEIREYTLSEEELAREFPDGYKRLPDEVHKTLEVIPRQFLVLEHHVAVYAGKKEDKVLRADAPKGLLPHSIATPSLVASIMNGKYVNGMPLYRMEQELQRQEIRLSRQTMANWVIRSTERYLSLICDRMREDLLSESVIHADETPVLVNKDGRKAGSKSYMWVYCNNDPEKEIILYDYQMTRAANHPKEYLKDFSGTLVTDGYQVYHTMEKKAKEKSRTEETETLKVAGCWAHARRPFADILKSAKKITGKENARTTIAAEAIEKIKEIYKEDNALKDLPPEDRLKARKEELEPLVKAYFEWVKEKRQSAVKGSALGKALQYSFNQEKYLKVFLENPDVPLDNNRAERAIRSFTIGRKNWVMIDTIHGAKSSAMLYSLAETAKANGLKPYEYFKYLLEEIPKHMEETSTEFLEDLLPWSKVLPERCRKTEEPNKQ